VKNLDVFFFFFLLWQWQCGSGKIWRYFSSESGKIWRSFLLWKWKEIARKTKLHQHFHCFSSVRKWIQLVGWCWQTPGKDAKYGSNWTETRSSLEFLRSREAFLFALFIAFAFWQQNCVDVRQDSTRSDGHTRHHFVELFVISNGQLNVTGNDSRSLVVFGGVSSQFKNFCAEIFEHCSHVDWSSSTNTFGISSLSQKTGNTAHRERETSSRRARLAFGAFGSSSTFSFGRHFVWYWYFHWLSPCKKWIFRQNRVCLINSKRPSHQAISLDEPNPRKPSPFRLQNRTVWFHKMRQHEQVVFSRKTFSDSRQKVAERVLASIPRFLLVCFPSQNAKQGTNGRRWLNACSPQFYVFCLHIFLAGTRKKFWNSWENLHWTRSQPVRNSPQ